MLDIKFVRENPEAVKENIKKKFQDHKLPLVDEVLELDARNRAAMNEASALRAERNKLSKTIGALMGQGKREEAEQVKAQVAAQADRLIVMTGGHIAADGTPKEVFADVEGLKAIGLTVPETVELCWELRKEGLDLPLDALSDEECAQALYKVLS